MISYIRKLLGLCEHEYKVNKEKERLARIKGKLNFVDLLCCEKCGNMKIVKTK